MIRCLLLTPVPCAHAACHWDGGAFSCTPQIATVVVFVASVATGNTSAYDIFWSVAPPVLAAAMAVSPVAKAQGLPLRRGVLLILVVFWGVRLTCNWWLSWHSLRYEDWRYIVRVWRRIAVTCSFLFLWFGRARAPFMMWCAGLVYRTLSGFSLWCSPFVFPSGHQAHSRRWSLVGVDKLLWAPLVPDSPSVLHLRRHCGCDDWFGA